MENAKQPRFFWMTFILLLLMPLIVGFFIMYLDEFKALNKVSLSKFLFFYMPLNYVYMAFPQLILGAFALKLRFRRKILLVLMALLNVLTIIFQCVTNLMNAINGNFFWVFYLPLGAVALAWGISLLLKNTEPKQAIS